ncbi:MAG: hypothetical protein JWN50_304 [Parcubacteria group bacterium]|nr:hypothetical protein [Parcubacteria group bacterium]
MKRYFLIFIFLFLPLFSRAATATLVIDTGFDSVNTLEATVMLPPNVHISSIADGGSMILIWLKEPVTDENARTITFTGLTPGGFTGTHAVFSFTGDFSESDIKTMSVSHVTALKNDGKGTVVRPFLTLEPGTETADAEPPVPFLPVVAMSKDLSAGQAFVSFLSEDKGAGIDHYEYATTFIFSPKAGDWQTTGSPLLLSASDASKKIYIKAVDRAGNERIEEINGPKYYERIGELAILISILICALYYGRRFSSHSFSR